MGFLDRKDRVLDVVLTEEGRRQFALGKLEFAYFSVNDDLIDYDPWISDSGSYDAAGLEERRNQLIESTPLLEAPIVLRPERRRDAVSALAPTSSLFTAAQRYSRLPSMVLNPSGSASLSVIQYPTAVGTSAMTYGREQSTYVLVDLGHVGDIDQATGVGFKVEVYESSSDGLKNLSMRRDLSERPSYDAFLVIDPDKDGK